MNYDEHIKSLFQHCKVHKIFGTAGAGKTTFLIKELNELFEEGIMPEQIAFVSFTKKAINELIERTTKQFKQFNKNQFKYFKTIHAICYASAKNKNVITQKELNELASSLGMPVSTFKDVENGGGSKLGDKIMTIESLSRLRMAKLEGQWKECNFQDCPLFMVEKWQEKLKKYKKENYLIDFTDMLEDYNSTLPVDYVFIDEAQDLCPLQWDVMNVASKDCKKVYIAGDDDQSIFNWAGAEVDYILNIKNDEETILEKSYRMPKEIFNLSRKILKKIKKRKKKNCKDNGRSGEIKHLINFESLDFKNGEDYLILVRNRWQIKMIKEYFIDRGLPFYIFSKNSLVSEYTEAIKYWERSRRIGKVQETLHFKKIRKYSNELKNLSKKEEVNTIFFMQEWYKMLDLIPFRYSNYLRKVLRKRYKISFKPRIKISTIHQAKGGEADNVILFPDVSYNVWKHLQDDNEHKVWYVAITRAKKRIYLMKENSNKFYRI